MKIKSIPIAIMGCAAVLLSSCVTDAGVWGASVGYSSPGFSSSVAWTNASYDVNGFPIYGYAYGRPVYGYTAAGAAIFSIAALTAWCYVPNWGPAPWYHGHHHYPHHCHRVPAPPKYAPGHKPHARPSGGMNAPIHKNPSSVLGKPIGHSGKPNHNVNHGKPAQGMKPGNHVGAVPGNGRPNANLGARPNNNRPNANVGARPNNNRPSVNVGNRPNNSRPSVNVGNRPNNSRPSVNTSARPSMSRPSVNTSARPSMSRPSANTGARPSMSRPGGNSGGRPSMGGAGRSGGARRR